MRVLSSSALARIAASSSSVMGGDLLDSVADRHLREGCLDPTGHRGVTDLVRGLAKLRATRQKRKRPLLLDDVLWIIDAMDHDVYPRRHLG
ncbi:hypothetical protein [Saccharopolyspora hattusasensis]|uniref:hypothetical protein n=1 Tax=Saccharopolyspora hattusasensis TaxID=1128679 RepID=UPI003D96A6FB